MRNPVWLLLFAVVAQGCAHGSVSPTEKRLDDKLAQEETIKTNADLKAETTKLLETSKRLNPRQRTELESLRASTNAQLDKIRAETLKLRAILISDVVSSDYNSDEVDLIKHRIKDLEQKKLSTYFDAVREANIMLGRWASKGDRITSDVLDQMTYEMFMF